MVNIQSCEEILSIITFIDTVDVFEDNSFMMIEVTSRYIQKGKVQSRSNITNRMLSIVSDGTPRVDQLSAKDNKRRHVLEVAIE